jgi:excisionase family DNA binding protein
MTASIAYLPEPSNAGHLAPLLLTPTEAGRVLSVGRTTVYHLMSTGLLESVHIGRSRRITPEAIRKYIDSLTPGEC